MEKEKAFEVSMDADQGWVLRAWILHDLATTWLLHSGQML